MAIHQAQYLISSAEVGQCPPPDRPEYAFIGRSNVGKSSLINLLTGQKNLAKTSATPGKTQLINHFSISSSRLPQSKKNHWYLVDLPGYGYAKIAQTERARWEKMIAHYLTRRTNLTEVFVLIDSRHSPQKIDLAFVHQLGKWGVPFSLVFTKSDKEKPGAVTRHVQEFLEALKKTWQFLPRHFVTSVETKAGRDEIIRHIEGSNELLLNPESVR